MMTPRAYHYVARPSSRSPSPSRRRKDSPSQPSKAPSALRSKSSSNRLIGSPKLRTVSPVTPSQPVVIPTRPQSARPRRTDSERDENLEKRGWDSESRTVPPSMAALLAVTTVPHSMTLAARRKASNRDKEASSLRRDDFRPSVSSSSPKSWTILQSSPDDYYDDDHTEKSVDLDTDASSFTSNSGIKPSSSFRSLSSESIPSLDIDLDSESTRSLSPPSAIQRPRIRARRDRLPSPVVPVSSDGEHPLATASFPDSPPTSPPLTPVPEERHSETSFQQQPTRPPLKSFKSNLTASLRLLKSAAKVLGAPARLHDPSSLTIPTDTTQRAIRIRTSAGNNLPPGNADFFVSANIDGLPFHLSAQLPGPVPTMSVQLQPCQTSPLSTPTASAPPIFLAAMNPPLDPYQKKPFQREPRENGDFLRVVVCEMNMRRAGKLSGEGRARIWLGARQEVKIDATGDATEGIADGGEARGAVMLDGELGEAREVDIELQHQSHHPDSSETTMRGTRRVPRRWVPKTP